MQPCLAISLIRVQGGTRYLTLQNCDFMATGEFACAMDPKIHDDAQGGITGDESSKALDPPPLQTSEHHATLPSASNVIRKFNRDTAFLAAGLLGSVIFAALVLGLQDWNSKTAHPVKEQRQTDVDALVNGDHGTLPKAAVLNAENSTGEINLRQTTSVHQAFVGIPPQENPSLAIEIAESIQPPVPALTPETNPPSPEAKATPWSSAHQKDFARAIRSKIHDIGRRSPVRVRYVSVKMRLIALWHESLAHSQRLPSSAGFSIAQKRRNSYSVP
jgi:hypothetical protein